MYNLEMTHPVIAVEFNKGNFTVNKSGRLFSSIALDHGHEQNNAAVKGDGGVVGLTQNFEALRRWMGAGPELVRGTAEFEACIAELHKRTSEVRHHDQTKSIQMIFTQHVKSLVGVMEELGNPFLEEGKELLRLDTRDILDAAVASSICQAEKIGKENYEAFVTSRLIKRSTSLSEPVVEG